MRKKGILNRILCIVSALAVVCTAVSCRKTEEAAVKTVLVTDPGLLPLTEGKERPVITVGIQRSVYTEDYETNEYTLWLEEQTGVDLQFVLFSPDKAETARQLQNMVDSNQKLPDILMRLENLDNSTLNSLGEAGKLIDLKPYFDNYAYFWDIACDRVEDPKLISDIMKCGIDSRTDACYGFPWVEVANPDTSTDTVAYNVWFNRKWLDAIGEPVPETAADLKRVLKGFSENDLNGNGKKDEIPSVCYTDGYRCDMIQWMINAFVYCDDTNFYNVTDGKLWVPYNTAEYRRALCYMNELYSEGLISPRSFTISNDDELKEIATPADGVAVCGLVGAHTTRNMDKTNDVVQEYTASHPLADETGKGGYGVRVRANVKYNTAITKDCENPKLAFRLLDFISSDEAMCRCRFGTRGRDWDWAGVGELDYAERQAGIKLYNPDVYVSRNNVNWHWITSGIMNFRKNTNVYTRSYGSNSDSVREATTLLIENNREAGTPDETVWSLAYNYQEQVIVNLYADRLKEYVRKERNRFISGIVDPKSDEDWNAYVNGLSSLGLESCILAAQSAWDRMNR